MVSMGIYVFEPAVMPYIKRNEYLDFPDLIKILIASGERVVAYEFDGYWKILGGRMITRAPQKISKICVNNSCQILVEDKKIWI